MRGEHPMKCFFKSLFGNDTYTHDMYHKDDNHDICTPVPPLVKSLLGSVVFIILMAILSHMLRM